MTQKGKGLFGVEKKNQIRKRAPANLKRIKCKEHQVSQTSDYLTIKTVAKILDLTIMFH